MGRVKKKLNKYLVFPANYDKGADTLFASVYEADSVEVALDLAAVDYGDDEEGFICIEFSDAQRYVRSGWKKAE